MGVKLYWLLVLLWWDCSFSGHCKGFSSIYLSFKYKGFSFEFGLLLIVNYCCTGGDLMYCRAAAAALMLGDEFYKFGQARAERNDFLAMGLAEKVNSANRQIYLTFPADSTFKDEDVSNYFRYLNSLLYPHA